MIACSATKKKDAGLLPALVRYDGPAFRILRTYLRRATEPPTLLILSAKYGLIEADHAIPDYDCRITAGIAEAIRPDVLRALGAHLGRTRYEELAFCVGHDYQKVVEGYETVVTPRTRVTFIPGGQGRRLWHLGAWLRREQPFALQGDP